MPVTFRHHAGGPASETDAHLEVLRIRRIAPHAKATEWLTRSMETLRTPTSAAPLKQKLAGREHRIEVILRTPTSAAPLKSTTAPTMTQARTQRHGEKLQDNYAPWMQGRIWCGRIHEHFGTLG